MRKPLSFYFSLIVFSLLISACSDDYDLQEINEEVITEEGKLGTASTLKSNDLAVRFAPKLWLHSCENLFPSDPQWFMRRVDMKFTRKGSDRNITSFVSESNIASRSFRDGSSSCRKHDDRSGHGYPSNFYMQIQNYQETQTRLGSRDLTDLKLVVSIRDREGYSDHKTIQYWMFYPYNALCHLPFCYNPNATGCGVEGAHEGDWERITVIYSKSQDKAVRVYMASHDAEGRYYSPRQITWIDDHPIVYSAVGSHASYSKAGTFYRGILPADHTNQGTPIETWTLDNYVIENCDTWGCLDVAGVPNFIKYSGFWGELGATFANIAPGNGPIGPAYRREFFDPLEDRDSDDYPIGPIFIGSRTYNATTDAPNQHIYLKDRWGWQNDDIDGMILSNVKKGTLIRLFDSPCGSTNDDWAEIYVKRDISPTTKIRITSLEQNIFSSSYSLTYHEDNGLNRKVSLITIDDL